MERLVLFSAVTPLPLGRFSRYLLQFFSFGQNCPEKSLKSLPVHVHWEAKVRLE